MKKFLFSLLVVFIGQTSAYASNADVLKGIYDSGTGPAAATDFPEQNYSDGSYVDPNHALCVVVDGTDQPYGFNVSRQIRITPPAGPLLPGQTEEKLVFGDTLKSYNLFQTPQTSGLDLVDINPIYKTWVSDTDGVNHYVPAQLFARKSNQYIAFRILIQYHSSSIQDEEYYGYCYTQGKALF